MRKLGILGLLVMAFSCRSSAPEKARPPSVNKARRVVITIDDLPVATRLYRADVAAQARITNKLLAAIKSRQVPAIGFVNEGKVVSKNEADLRSVEFLRQWLQAGAELGNHTHSHSDLHKVSVEAFIADIARGELTTRRVLAEQDARLRYFRHPYLHTGRSETERQAVDTFLTERGYRVAPVTIDNADYIYAVAYERALAKSDEALASRVGESYVDYMVRYFAFYERTSRDLLGYELPQILLIHANALNADYLGQLLDAVAQRGYRFIDLDEALEDPAYQSDDRYFGPAGITWLHRWALTEGRRGAFFHGEPRVDEYVNALAEQAP